MNTNYKIRLFLMFTVPSHETAAILHHDLLIQSAYLLDLFEV